MSIFAGLVAWQGQPPSSRDEAQLVAILRRRGFSPAVERLGRALFVHGGDPFCPAQKQGLSAVDARLDNGADLMPGGGRADGDTAVVRHVYETHGEEGLARILGAFAFAHWDERAQRLILARDCGGRRPLFFHRAAGKVAFASLLPDLLAIPEVPRQIDETMLASFLALDHRETSRTFYRGIDRVPTRSLVELTREGTRIRRYWRPRLRPDDPPRKEEAYVEEARERFDRAVARSLRDTPRAALPVSGGLDSSAVAATAARLGFGNVECYTAAAQEAPCFNNEYPDERPKVEALARLYPALPFRFVTPTAPEVAGDPAQRWFLDFALPARNAGGDMEWFSALGQTIARDSHNVLVNGAMGNYSLSWPGHFSLPALLEAGRPREMLREMRALSRATARPLWRVAGGELILRAAPRAVQRMFTRLTNGDPDDVSRLTLLDRGAIEALGLRERWRENGFDPYYRQFGSSTALRAHQIFDQLQATHDIVAMSGASTGIERRDPFADRELVEFCLAVPEWLYRKNGVARSFARAVFADRLPPEILRETRRGAQAPNWFEFLEARKSQIEAEAERIEASSLASRLIDVPRLKRLIATWPKDAAEAEARSNDYRLALPRAIHASQFIRWVEGGNG